VTADLESGPATGRPAGEILAWSKTAVSSGLRAAVTGLPPSMRHIAGYHFGWWDSGGEPIQGNSGKAVRPALALLSAQAVGCDPERAVPAAVAVELVHNFSLLHDDVMDRDQMRRHRPTAWMVFGVADAILAGDALLALAFQCLASGHPPSGAEGIGLLSRCVAELCHGQSLDISFEQRDHVEADECWAMAAAKTGALFACACSLGALAGGAGAGQVARLGDFGGHLGLALQLVDDLLGIWGDPGVTGKPVYSDLRSRKKSLPVTAALNSGTAAGEELAGLYRRPQPLRRGELAHAADLIEQAGAREWTHRRAQGEITLATEGLAAAGCQPEAEAALREVARLLMARDH
jgi:geranylgeranyl diphosphate synthase, type I